MTLKAILENRKLNLKGPLAENQMFIRAARVEEVDGRGGNCKLKIGNWKFRSRPPFTRHPLPCS